MILFNKTLLLGLITAFTFNLHSAEEVDTYFDDTMDPLEMAEAYRDIQGFEGHPEYLEEYRARFQQLRKKSMDEKATLDLLPKPLVVDYLFKREGTCSTCDQDINQSETVLKRLKKERPSKVYFNKDKIYPFDEKGTCSAMALDFLVRYFRECAQLTNKEQIRERIKQFAPYYKLNTRTYISRQSSYNTIEVDRQTAINNPEEIKYRKIQSLANYHDLGLTPVTKTIKRSSIASNPNDFINQVNGLPYGYYVVRCIYPADNVKMESYGHTMILVKTAGFSVFFDNGDGAVDITDDVGGYVKDKILSRILPEVRFYKAQCKNNCKHLSTEKS